MEHRAGILAWILIGLIAGWLAARINHAPRGLLRNLVVDLLGSLHGGFLSANSAFMLCPISGANSSLPRLAQWFF